MRNPFEYGGVVGGSAFCNRKKELSDLVRAMENSEKLFLYSERRLGKTSLIHYALSKLPKDNYASAYVDLWATDGEVSFVTATARTPTIAASNANINEMKTVSIPSTWRIFCASARAASRAHFTHLYNS